MFNKPLVQSRRLFGYDASSINVSFRAHTASPHVASSRLWSSACPTTGYKSGGPGGERTSTGSRRRSGTSAACSRRRALLEEEERCLGQWSYSGRAVGIHTRTRHQGQTHRAQRLPGVRGEVSVAGPANDLQWNRGVDLRKRIRDKWAFLGSSNFDLRTLK